MSELEVYDFDKTIYNGDSTVDFFIYCFKQKKITIWRVAILMPYTILFLLKIKSQKEYKEIFFSFLNDIDDISQIVNSFWETNKHKLGSWYLEKSKHSHIIISASPRFLLEKICEEMKVKDLLATEMDSKTGKINGENCYGEEKVKRFQSVYKNVKILEFYSDSYSDQPMADLAEKNTMIVNGELRKWNEKKETLKYKLKSTFFSRTFFQFLAIGCINAFNGVFFAYLFDFIFNTNTAFVVGYGFSLTIAYLLNCLFIFKEKIKIKTYINFAISYIPNFIIQNIVVFLLYNVLGVMELIAFAVAAIVSVPITFLFVKLFVFKK